MPNFFNFLPILGTYRLTYYKSVILRAPPTVLRLCVLFEVSIAIGVFVVAYYYTATTPTTETIVTYAALDSPYTCSVLSPRSDTQVFSDSTSELAAFSQARFDYTSCLNTLGPKGYDLCANGNREDYLLTISGIGTETSTCTDIILENNYRFCNGGEEPYDLRTPAQKLQFTTYVSPSNTYSNQYYFMNSSDNITLQGNFPSTSGTILSDYVSDGLKNVFVVQSPSQNSPNVNLYQFGLSLQETKVVAEINSVSVYGLTYGNRQIFTWTINNANIGNIHKYDLNTEDLTTSSGIQCINTLNQNDKVGSRYISYGSDGKLYAICTSTVLNSPSNFSYLQIDPDTWSTTSYTVNIGSLDYITKTNTTSMKINTVTQVFRIGHSMYFIATGPATNLLQADLTNMNNQGTTIHEVINLGFVDGASVGILGSETDLYFVNTANQTYFNTTKMSLETNYPLSNSKKTYFLSTYLQLGFSYQICNGNYSHYQVHTGTSSSFSSLCDEINGIYYQNNQFYNVPESCKGYLSSETEAESIVNCPAVLSLRNEFVSQDCEASYDEVCNAEFTDNPPFSCSKDVYPSFLSTIGTAIADSSGAWSVIVIIMQFLLKCFYPHGTLEFDYDEKLNRFLPVNHSKFKIHPGASSSAHDYILTNKPVHDIESGGDGQLFHRK